VAPCINSHSGLFVGVLGHLIVIRDGIRRELPASRKTRALLAYLSLTQRPCRREELCDLLWEGTSDPRSEVRWSLAKIKAAVGPWLEVSRDGIALASDGLSVDGVAFRELALQTLSERSIAEALALWRGAPLTDVEVSGQQAFRTWLAAKRDDLAVLRANLLKAAVDLAWARPEDALAAARRLVAAEPWNEWGHARVVQLLECCGRTVEASDYAVATRKRLSEEFGVAGASLVVAPPPPARIAVSDEQPPAPVKSRPSLRIEPFKLAPRGEESSELELRITAELNTAFWRQGVCAVTDSLAGRDMTSAEFALRGVVTGGSHPTRVWLRCVHLACGALVWSDQIEFAEVSGGAGLQEWLERAVEAIGVAVQLASTEINDADNVQGRIAAASVLTGALEPVANGRALALLKNVLTVSEDEPAALSLSAWCHAQRVVYNWSGNSDQDRLEAKRYASAATLSGINDPKCLTVIATARMLVGNHNGAETLLERSLRLDRYEPVSLVRRGWLANYLENARDATRHFRAAIRLAPLHPAMFNALTGLGVSHFIEGDHSQAIRRMEQALALNPKAIWIHRNLAPAYMAAHETQKAEGSVASLLESHPHLTVAEVTDAMVFSRPVMAKIAEGLRGAGLPL